jgi:ComEC/Rec2-related protein
MRAVSMQVILMISVFFYREYDAMTALFAALLLLLLQNPFSILSASLMLSFSATFGILLLNGVLLQMFWRHRPKNRALAKIYGCIVSTITVSFSAMVFTMPVTLLIFGSASMLSLISNLLIIWAVSVVMIGGIFMLAAAVISMALAEILAKILHVPLTYMVWVITKLGGLVEFVGQSGSFVLEVAALFVLLCMILVRISKKEQAFGVVTAIITLIFGFAVSSLDPVLYNEVQIFGNYGAPIVLIRDGARTIAVGTGEDPENSIYHMEDALSGWNRSDLSAVICLSDRLKSTGGLATVRKELEPEHIFLPIHGYVEGMDQGSFWAFSDGGVLHIPDATGKIELIPLTNDIWALRWTGKTVSFLLLFDGQPLELAAGLENYRGDVSADVLITDAKLLDSSHASAYVCRRVSPQVIFAADSSFDSVPAQVLGVPVTSLNEQESITLVTKR